MNPDYFYFKQFKIRHANAAMKVGTDGVLLGAWVDCGNAKRVLDVGTGTGLLAMMLAQKSQAAIDAVEIDKDAGELAKFNIQNSPWFERINVINADIRDYHPQKKYDLIISNPPFYSTDVIAPDASRAKARHTISLSPVELMQSVARLLDKSGFFYVIYPFNVRHNWEDAAKEFSLYKNKELIVKPNPTKNPVRIISSFSFEQRELVCESISIEKHTRHDYSDEYRNLTKDYYTKTRE